MALTAVQLASRALLKLGARPLASFAEQTPEAEIARQLYPPLRDALLSAHPWSFATAQTRLPQLAGIAPAGDYAYAYQLPAGFLRALSAGTGVRGRGLDYRITGRALHASAGDLLLTYIFRPAEEDFPAFFDQLVIARLAAEFCLPVTESTSRAEALTRIAGEELKLARLIDAQQDAAPRIEDFTLLEARGQ